MGMSIPTPEKCDAICCSFEQIINMDAEEFLFYIYRFFSELIDANIGGISTIFYDYCDVNSKD
jgi:hypothetical protein